MTEREWFDKCVDAAAAGHAIPTKKVLCTSHKSQIPAMARLEVVRHFREQFPQASRPFIAGLFKDRAEKDPAYPFKTPDQSSITHIVRRIERANADVDIPQPVESGDDSLAH